MTTRETPTSFDEANDQRHVTCTRVDYTWQVALEESHNLTSGTSRAYTLGLARPTSVCWQFAQARYFDESDPGLASFRVPGVAARAPVYLRERDSEQLGARIDTSGFGRPLPGKRHSFLLSSVRLDWRRCIRSLLDDVGGGSASPPLLPSSSWRLTRRGGLPPVWPSLSHSTNHSTNQL